MSTKNDSKGLATTTDSNTTAAPQAWGAILGVSAGAALSVSSVPALPAPGDKVAAKAWAVAVERFAAGFNGVAVQRLDTDAARESKRYSLAAEAMNDAGKRPTADLSSYRYPESSPLRGKPAWQGRSLANVVKGFSAL